MAEYSALQYWLESINLPQYYVQFVDNGVISYEACANLDQQRLIEIGVSLPGHQRRILSHLPDNDNWVETSTCLPNLPPKKKSARDSYLYENVKSLDVLTVQTDTDMGKDTPTKVSPRPVPRPRQRTSTAKSPATTPVEEVQKQVKRPTPAPRNVTSPKTSDKQTPVPLSEKDEHSKTTFGNSENFNSDTNFSNSALGFEVGTSDTRDVSNKSETLQNSSMEIKGVCSQESSTDEQLNSESYGASIKPDNALKNVAKTSATNNIEDNKSYGKKHLIENQDLSKGEDVEVDEIYVNFEIEDLHYKNIPEIPERISKEVKGASYIESFGVAESYVNAEFDQLLGMYKVKQEFDNRCEDSNRIHGLPEHLFKSDDGDSDTRGNTDSPKDAIYEPIWEDKRKEPVRSQSQSNRDSSLMQFPSLDKETVVARPKDSNIIKNRDTTFNMPHPQFAPPPLPVSVGGMKDVIAHFDPLSDSTGLNMPPVPPRSSTYYSPSKAFRPYENLQYPTVTKSATLPGNQDDLQPEMSSNSPSSLSYRDASSSRAEDPFKYEDPFGQFKPDCEDFNPPSTCKTKIKENAFGLSNSSVNTSANFDAIYDVTTEDDIYEPAEDPDAFDPFGLNRKPSYTFIPRSMSSGSNQNRLSEVPPAPKWYQPPQEPGRMYSVAGNFHDGDSSSDGSSDDLIDSGRGDDASFEGSMKQVDILPTTALSPRKKERSGYLYKQGGVKQNRGWRKRWVIFDGKTLRYYSNARDQVSKRIVPVSCMTNVEMDVKDRYLSRITSSELFMTYSIVNSGDPIQTVQMCRLVWIFSPHSLFLSPFHLPNNSRQFKFKLHCTNRVFLFATDNLDDCKMWSNTLMEAIITYVKPEGGEVPGGDMANPDIDAWIKIDKNRYKFYVVLKKQKLCYYQNADDYKMASPLHEIDMKLSSVKEVERTKLQLNTHYSKFLLHFESSSDASNWKMAIEEAITDALGDNSILDQVKENPDNSLCVDCGAPDAHWASMNLGIVLCLRCAGIHRGFDHRISKIRSLRMDTRVWNSSLIEMFKEIGNDNANNFWLRNMPPGASINMDTPMDVRKQHIHSKYKDKIYCDKHPLAANRQQLNEALVQSAQTGNVLMTYQILMSGADVMFTPASQQKNAFEMAKEAHQRIQMEFLLQNGGDRTKNFMPGSEEASLVAKLRSEVQWQGYLHKTGSNMKDFLRRWCVLEHGHLSYFVSEESKVEKDRIDNESMLCIQAVQNDKHVSCFEISSKKNNRVYLFSASNDKERLHWIQCIAQVFCPVDLMGQIRRTNFSLAGYTYLKTGFNREWQRSWFILENRKLIFIDKEETERDQESIDLRKVSSITKIANSETSCDSCLESHGPMFVLKAYGDRVLYMQADLVKDTERIYTALEADIKKSGDILDDQVLDNNDIPVIVSTCIDFIERQGLTLDGLYRKAEQESKIKTLLKNFKEDARCIVLGKDGESVHLVCNVLKRFLRNLKDPLLTEHLYKRWIVYAGEADHNVKLQWYKYLLQQLPRINYLTLKCLATHLSKLSEHEAENLMTLSNISIAFGPTLMKSDHADNTTVSPSNVGDSMKLEINVISDIVTYHNWLFDSKDEEGVNSVEKNIIEAKKKMDLVYKGMTTAAPYTMQLLGVYHLDPKGNSYNVSVNTETTAADIVHTLTGKLKLTGSWTLHEVITDEIERTLHPETMIWPLKNEWQNWSENYKGSVKLCLKSSTDLHERLEQAYSQSKSLFAEMKYSKKGKFKKMQFEFTQARLSCYKDTKNKSNPAGSWNIEDLSIYKGCDSKRSPPTKYTFTFFEKGEHAGDKEMPYFGHAVCCTSEQELLSWIAGLLVAQHPSGFS